MCACAHAQKREKRNHVHNEMYTMYVIFTSKSCLNPVPLEADAPGPAEAADVEESEGLENTGLTQILQNR